jgi:hypothetical protein
MYALNHLSKSLALVACLTLGAAAQAQSSGSFECITNNSAQSCAQGESTLSWTWNGTDFTILNAAGGGYVSEVYFDLTSPMVVSFNAGLSSVGVSFTSGANPGSLSGGNSYGFASDMAFDSDARRSAPVWGINALEHAVFSFTGAAPSSFDVGTLAAGVHVRRLFNGESESLTTVTAVPEPGTYAMILAGLGVMGFVARRRRQV